MRKKVFSTVAASLLLLGNLGASTGQTLPDCGEVALDLMDVHESHFGCMDAETSNEMFELLVSLCEGVGIN